MDKKMKCPECGQTDEEMEFPTYGQGVIVGKPDINIECPCGYRGKPIQKGNTHEKTDSTD